MHELTFSTKEQFEVIDITDRVRAIIKKSKGKQCIVYTPHATAAIVINEGWDPDIGKDLLDALDKAVPLHAGYRHDKVDNNAAAHIKAAILGPSETLLIENGKLILGRWQNIFFVELDGPRNRRKVYVKIF
ncbi:MAG: secondary thiamine-phosphate synthase enzyme YjbQ [Candidatus Aenigmatarchaeota archaeon]